MTQPVNPDSLAEYEGKKVNLTVADAESEGGTKTLEGKAEKSNAKGVLIKPKGKTGLELYTADQVLGVEVIPEKPKDIKAKTLKLVEPSTVKQHLVDRHGYKLSEVNPMEEQAAFEFHATLDHADLGHLHKADEPKADEPAADAGDEPTAESAPEGDA